MTVIDPMHNILLGVLLFLHPRIYQNEYTHTNLGVMKNQWFDTWVKGGALRERTSPKGVPRELDSIHHYLRSVCTYSFGRTHARRLTPPSFQFEMPAWAARLPKNVGYPAGGSLTSDEWKCLLLIYGPLVVRKSGSIIF